MTHGFRVVPIILSAALGYLTTLRAVHLDAVYYCAEGKNGLPGTVVDLADFYRIQGWADGLSRLVEDADAEKLVRLAEDNPVREFPLLSDSELVAALRDLTTVIKNVVVHDVPAVAATALGRLRAAIDKAPDGADRQMLEIAAEKFAALATEGGEAQSYDGRYLAVQAALARVLLEHGFLMQAFTVLRELVGSVGLVACGAADAGRPLKTKDPKLRRLADVFVNMQQYAQETWRFEGQDLERCNRLIAAYDRLKMLEGDRKGLRASVAIIAGARNGFSHAWTAVGATKRPGPAELRALRDEGLAALGMIEEAISWIGANP
jgi:hypothetical protein